MCVSRGGGGCKLRTLLVCLIYNFDLFNKSSLSSKIYSMCQVIVYYDVLNVQPPFNFSNDITK